MISATNRINALPPLHLATHPSHPFLDPNLGISYLQGVHLGVCLGVFYMGNLQEEESFDDEGSEEQLNKELASSCLVVAVVEVEEESFNDVDSEVEDEDDAIDQV